MCALFEYNVTATDLITDYILTTVRTIKSSIFYWTRRLEDLLEDLVGILVACTFASLQAQIKSLKDLKTVELKVCVCVVLTTISCLTLLTMGSTRTY